MSFKFVVHEIADEVELDTETFSFDSLPEMLTTLAFKIQEVEREGFKYNSVGVGEALDLDESEAVGVVYYVNGSSEWQFELSASNS